MGNTIPGRPKQRACIKKGCLIICEQKISYQPELLHNGDTVKQLSAVAGTYCSNSQDCGPESNSNGRSSSLLSNPVYIMTDRTTLSLFSSRLFNDKSRKQISNCRTKRYPSADNKSRADLRDLKKQRGKLKSKIRR